MQKVPKLGLNYRKYSENRLGLPKLGLGLLKIYRKCFRVTEIRVSFAENILKFAKNT